MIPFSIFFFMLKSGSLRSTKYEVFMKQRSIHSIFVLLTIGGFLSYCEFTIPGRIILLVEKVNPSLGPSIGNKANPTTITLTGNGFTLGTKVMVGNNSASVASVHPDGTQLQFLLPDSPGSFGPIPITITFENGTVLTLKDETMPTPKKGFSYYLSNLALTKQTSTGVLTTGGIPSGIVAGDFDEESKHKDIAVIYSNNNNVDILSGNGQGSFSKSATSSTILPYPHLSITTADFNKNNLLDLVVTRSNGTNIIVLNQEPAGTFTGIQPIVGNKPQFAAIGDVNGDGYPDIVTANDDMTNPISIILNTKDKTNVFNEATMSPSIAFSPDVPKSIIAQDFDGDNQVDLAILPSTTTSFYILKNMKGTWGSPFATNVGFTPQSGIAALLSGGTLAEIAFINPSGTNKTADIFRNVSTASNFFFPKVPSPFNVGGAITDPTSIVTTGDIDQDGFPDLIINTGSTINVLINVSRENQGINFKSAFTVSAATPIKSVTVADFTGDGLLDIVAIPYLTTAPASGSDIILFKNTSN